MDQDPLQALAKMAHSIRRSILEGSTDERIRDIIEYVAERPDHRAVPLSLDFIHSLVVSSMVGLGSRTPDFGTGPPVYVGLGPIFSTLYSPILESGDEDGLNFHFGLDGEDLWHCFLTHWQELIKISVE